MILFSLSLMLLLPLQARTLQQENTQLLNRLEALLETAVGQEGKKKVLAYWDKGNCGPDGDDYNWDMCGVRSGCPESFEGRDDLCASGKGRKISERKKMEKDGCFYYHYAEYECIVTDKDCELGDAPTPADCDKSCGDVKQKITAPAVGNGLCFPQTYSCRGGDGKCPVPDKNCVLGDAPTAADCDTSCGNVKQKIIEPAVGKGACNPQTYSCQPRDGGCPSDALCYRQNEGKRGCGNFKKIFMMEAQAGNRDDCSQKCAETRGCVGFEWEERALLGKRVCSLLNGKCDSPWIANNLVTDYNMEKCPRACYRQNEGKRGCTNFKEIFMMEAVADSKDVCAQKCADKQGCVGFEWEARLLGKKVCSLFNAKCDAPGFLGIANNLVTDYNMENCPQGELTRDKDSDVGELPLESTSQLLMVNKALKDALAALSE